MYRRACPDERQRQIEQKGMSTKNKCEMYRSRELRYGLKNELNERLSEEFLNCVRDDNENENDKVYRIR